MPTLAGIHHVGLSVTDIARSAAWYQEVLGFSKAAEVPDDGGRGHKVVLRHPEGGFIVGLALHKSNAGKQFSEFGTGLDHLAFAVADRAELDAWSQRLDQLGVEHGEISRGPTGWLFSFRDPDNIQLELYTLVP